MLGITPLVSMSESRLGLIMNSSIPRDSASEVLAISTSRSVRPICSRSSRNFLPAESTLFASPPALQTCLQSSCGPFAITQQHRTQPTRNWSFSHSRLGPRCALGASRHDDNDKRSTRLCGSQNEPLGHPDYVPPVNLETTPYGPQCPLSGLL